jgi:hypothetical protein
VIYFIAFAFVLVASLAIACALLDSALYKARNERDDTERRRRAFEIHCGRLDTEVKQTHAKLQAVLLELDEERRRNREPAYISGFGRLVNGGRA